MVATRLAALGLDCVGAVANLSAADLQRQFGPVGMDLWHQARGGDGRGEWSPGHGLGIPDPPRRLGERILLEGGTGDLEALRFAVHRSALDLGDRLRRHGCRAAAVTLVCELEDAEPSGLRITPLQQPGSGAELWPVALELLAGLALRAPVTAVRLEVEGLQPGACLLYTSGLHAHPHQGEEPPALPFTGQGELLVTQLDARRGEGVVRVGLGE